MSIRCRFLEIREMYSRCISINFSIVEKLIHSHYSIKSDLILYRCLTPKGKYFKLLFVFFLMIWFPAHNNPKFSISEILNIVKKFNIVDSRWQLITSKYLQGFLILFMVSQSNTQSGSVGFITIGKTADLTVGVGISCVILKNIYIHLGLLLRVC
jgi:hypothetical protein